MRLPVRREVLETSEAQDGRALVGVAFEASGQGEDLSSAGEEASCDWSVAQRVSPRRPAPGCEAKRTSNALPPGRWNRRAQEGHRRAFLHDGTGDVVMELRPLAHKLPGEHANS